MDGVDCISLFRCPRVVTVTWPPAPGRMRSLLWQRRLTPLPLSRLLLLLVVRRMERSVIKSALMMREMKIPLFCLIMVLGLLVDCGNISETI